MGFTFDQALKELKAGAKVAREGWNGKGMYLFIVSGKAVEDAVDEFYGNGWGWKTNTCTRRNLHVHRTKRLSSLGC